MAKLAILAGMHFGEIFALKWGRITARYAEIRRGYRRKIDSSKTDNSYRLAGLFGGCWQIEA